MQKMVVVIYVIFLLSCCIQQGERKSEGFTETVSVVGNVIILLEDALDNPPKLEYWIMNKDGSDKCRLSGFNYAGAPEYIDVDGGIGLGDYCMGPDGKTIVAKMRRGFKETVIVLIEFDV